MRSASHSPAVVSFRDMNQHEKPALRTHLDHRLSVGNAIDSPEERRRCRGLDRNELWVNERLARGKAPDRELDGEVAALQLLGCLPVQLEEAGERLPHSLPSFLALGVKPRRWRAVEVLGAGVGMGLKSPFPAERRPLPSAIFGPGLVFDQTDELADPVAVLGPAEMSPGGNGR